MKRYLILEDGTYFEGEAFGGSEFSVGELVFNTSMTGYQDILCDSSYCGQIINLTYPVIGQYGINREGFESINTEIFGIVVSEVSDTPSNFRSQMTVDDFLRLKNIPGIKGIDTRELTRKLRDRGVQKATFSNSIKNLQEIIEKIKKSQDNKNLVEKVSIQKPFHIPNDEEKIVLIDFGEINNILKILNSSNRDVTVVPYNTTSDEILGLHPDGVILSNGPGNPYDVSECIETCKNLIGEVPVFGIGLGHQIIAISQGAAVEKLKFGNMGSNYPVKNLDTQKVDIKTKNNSYSVSEKSLVNTGLRVLYRGVNAQTVEGIINENKFVHSIQFHTGVKFDKDLDENYKLFFKMIRDFKGE